MDPRFLMTPLIGVALALGLPDAASAQELCQGFGPQAPRDIASAAGSNARLFSGAPAASELNLCNIHAHRNAEHKGPGFTIHAGDDEHGGYRCNDSDQLSEAELENPTHGHGAFHGAAPGDSLEVHWVYTSCDVAPGKGLGACLSESCANPQLRVESQVFLLVNDPSAASFADFAAVSDQGGRFQPSSLPTGTGEPVVFAGSTTGPSFTQSTCSPLQVTWSVRPSCTRLDIGSLHAWAEAGNVFEEDHAHGVRQLVTAPELLAPID